MKLRLRTAAPFVAAFVAFACALTVGFFAYEVSQAEAEIRSSDAAFRVERAPEGLWQVNGAAEGALGLKDDLAFRRAALLWDEAHRRSFDRSANAGNAIAAGSRRAAAQLALAHAENEGLQGSARSKAANLEAVIVLQAALEAPANRGELLKRGLEGFRRAVRLDPTNEEAMLNLEFLLKLLSTNPPPPLNQYGLAQLGQGIAGSTPGRTGHGY